MAHKQAPYHNHSSETFVGGHQHGRCKDESEKAVSSLFCSNGASAIVESMLFIWFVYMNTWGRAWGVLKYWRFQKGIGKLIVRSVI